MLASGPSDASKISMRPARAAASTTNGSSEKAGAAANNKIGNVKNARIAPYLTGFSGSGIFGLTGSCGAGGFEPEAGGETDLGGFFDAGALYPGGFITMMPVYTGTERRLRPELP